VRTLANYQLKRSELGVWSLSGNHVRNGGLWLTDSAYKARVLYALSDEQVPLRLESGASRLLPNPAIVLGLPTPLFEGTAASLRGSCATSTGYC
jgi:hypothetical protein